MIDPDVLAVGLRIVGVGLLVAAASHIVLPRSLGWTADSHRETGPLSWLVVRLHVAFMGFFLAAFGVISVFSANDLVSGESWGRNFLTASVIIFGIRWLCEIFLVSKALRDDQYLAPWWRYLHAFGLVAWPMITIVYAMCWWRAITV